MSSAPSDGPLRLSASESIYLFFSSAPFCPSLRKSSQRSPPPSQFSCLFATAQQCALGCRAEKTLSPSRRTVLESLMFWCKTLLSAAAMDSLGCIKNIWLNLNPQQPDKTDEALFSLLPQHDFHFLKCKTNKPTTPPPFKKRRGDLPFIWQRHKVICE